MKQPGTLVLLLLLVGLTSASLYQTHNLETLIIRQEGIINAMLTTTWTHAKGTSTLTTRRGEHDPNETPDQHAARHLAELTAAQAILPPIQGQ